VDLWRGEALILAVVPLVQLVIELDDVAESRYLTSLKSTTKRARKHE
jgi:hypothetical protein